MRMNKMGFGFLRLPKNEKGIDYLLLNRMVDAFLAAGGKYFDTAYTYLDGQSEIALRESLVKRHPRASFQIADKLPGWQVKSYEDCYRYFNEQVERCGVDYFDVYLLHWLNRANYEVCEKYDEFAFLRDVKAQGRVGKIGFSFHDSAALLDEILTAHPETDIVQLQINYLDWESAAIEARKCYEVAVRHGKSIVVMEPVKGGTLANLPQDALDILQGAAPASWALRFVQSLEGVDICLSGMNTLEQIEENMRDIEPLSEQERAMLQKVVEIIESQTAIPCTGCRYCEKSCPQHIAIPDYFEMYNAYRRYPGEDWKIRPIYERVSQNHEKASMCINCKQCEQNCPQKLEITKFLKQVAEAFEQ